uniref:Uncharacterized protein n=1 Tax=Glossina austeni TaxID=7395 RepID=A0A1A9UIT9_GLOAU
MSKRQIKPTQTLETGLSMTSKSKTLSQTVYTKKLLEKFNMVNAKSISTAIENIANNNTVDSSQMIPYRETNVSLLYLAKTAFNTAGSEKPRIRAIQEAFLNENFENFCLRDIYLHEHHNLDQKLRPTIILFKLSSILNSLRSKHNDKPRNDLSSTATFVLYCSRRSKKLEDPIGSQKL